MDAPELVDVALALLGRRAALDPYEPPPLRQPAVLAVPGGIGGVSGGEASDRSPRGGVHIVLL